MGKRARTRRRQQPRLLRTREMLRDGLDVMAASIRVRGLAAVAHDLGVAPGDLEAIADAYADAYAQEHQRELVRGRCLVLLREVS